MTKFFTAVLIGVFSDERVQALLHGLIRAAVDEAISDVHAELSTVHTKVDELAGDVSGWVDGMDGKVGNLQQQLTAIPAQIIGAIIDHLQHPFG